MTTSPTQGICVLLAAPALLPFTTLILVTCCSCDNKTLWTNTTWTEERAVWLHPGQYPSLKERGAEVPGRSMEAGTMEGETCQLGLFLRLTLS